MRNGDLKDLAESFAEIEKRVQSLASENRALKLRVSGLEGELAAARREAQEAVRVQGKQAHVRDRIEHVLRTLDALGAQERGNGNSGRNSG